MLATARRPRSAPAASRGFDSPEQEAYLALWRTYDRLRAVEDDLFTRWDLTPQQYNVLRLLKGSHPDQVPTLSILDRLVSRAPDVTRIFDKLESRGLITRTRSTSDRRAVLVGISPRGLALLDQIAGPLRSCHARQLGHLRPSELRQLIQLLRRVRAPHEVKGSPWL